MNKNIDLLIRRALIESINELNLYHSSYTNFNKFNHKKYLSSGAGSQTFGWGTYLTDSYPIAKSYAEKFICFEFNKFIMSAEPENYINGIYDDNVAKEAIKRYKSIVRFAMTFSLPPDSITDRDFFDRNFEISDEDPSEQYDNALKEYEEYKKGLYEFFIIANKNSEKANVDMINQVTRNVFKAMHKDYIFSQSKDEYVKNFNFNNSVNRLVRSIINNIWDNADAHVKKEAYIYEVEIPDDNGYNYLYYGDVLSKKTIQLIENGISRLYMKYGDKININRLKMAIEDCYVGKMNGQVMYQELTSIFNNSEKAASLFLLNCGINGIKYKAGTIYDLPKDADENSYNYVIFDANKIKITSKNLFVNNF
jgi:hypothetical protein